MTETTQPSLSSRAKRGGLWVLAAKGFQSGIQLVSNVVLAWLLFPEDFGVLVPVTVFLVGLQLFSDIGIGPSIVHSKRGEDKGFLRTVWTVQLIRGFLLYGICIALAGPYARFIAEPVTSTGLREQEVIHGLLVVAGLSAIFSGFRSPNWFTVDRRIAQGRKTLILVVSQVVRLVTMVIWAWVTHSPMALVAGQLATALSQTILSHLLLPGVGMRLRFEKESLRELFGFGRWIFLSTAIFFLASQVDRILVSTLLEPGPRGLYRIAFVLATMVPGVLSSISGSVVFPTWMEAYRKHKKEFVPRVRRSRKALLSLGTSGLIGMITVVPFFILILYADRYQGAAWLAQLMCLPFWFDSLMATATSALLVHGDSRANAASNFMVLLVKAPACWFGFQWHGMEGFVMGMAAGSLVGLIVQHVRLAFHGTHLWQQDIRATLQLVVFGVVGYFISAYALTLPLGYGILLTGAAAAAMVFYTVRPAMSLLIRKQG
jgi:O-antigen/teichoic acid export membrane protein